MNTLRPFDQARNQMSSVTASAIAVAVIASNLATSLCPSFIQDLSLTVTPIYRDALHSDSFFVPKRIVLQ